MTNDTNPPVAPQADAAFPEWEETPWHVMVGIRTDAEGKADIRAVCTPRAATERASGGVHFDKTMPSVYFSDWFNRNRESLWKMAMHEHAMYMNLKRATEGIGKSAGRKLVDSHGERLN